MKKIIIAMFLLTAAVFAKVPGSTTDSVLENDVMPYVKMLAKAKVNQMDCANVVVKSAFLSQKPNGYEQRSNGKVFATSPYEETWNVNVCGKTVLVPIAFIPDSTGTSYAIKTDKMQVK